jgi:hypothetical protein
MYSPATVEVKSPVDKMPKPAPVAPTPPKSFTGKAKAAYTKYYADPVRRGVSDMSAGLYGTVASTADFIGGMTGWQAAKDVGSGLRNQMINPMMKQYVGEQQNFADQLLQGVGSTMTFFVPAAGVLKGVQAVDKLAKWAPLFANVAATAMESAAEAGNVYQQKIDSGSSEGAAKAAATRAFLANAVLIFASNKLGIFGESKSALRTALMSAPTEGLQEFAQQMIQNYETGRPLTEGAWEAGGIGAIIGPFVGGTMSAVSSTPGSQGPADYTATYKPELGGTADQKAEEALPSTNRTQYMPEAVPETAQDQATISNQLDITNNQVDTTSYGPERTTIQPDRGGVSQQSATQYDLGRTPSASVSSATQTSPRPVGSISRLLGELQNEKLAGDDGSRMVPVFEGSRADWLGGLYDGIRSTDLLNDPDAARNIRLVRMIVDAKIKNKTGRALSAQEQMDLDVSFLSALGATEGAQRQLSQLIGQVPAKLKIPGRFMGFTFYDTRDEQSRTLYGDSTAFFNTSKNGGRWTIGYNVAAFSNPDAVSRAVSKEVARHEGYAHLTYTFLNDAQRIIMNTNAIELAESLTEQEHERVWFTRERAEAYVYGAVKGTRDMLIDSGMTEAQAYILLTEAGLGSIDRTRGEFVYPTITRPSDAVKFMNIKGRLQTALLKRDADINDGSSYRDQYPKIAESIENNNERVIDEFRAHFLEGRVKPKSASKLENNWLLMENQQLNEESGDFFNPIISARIRESEVWKFSLGTQKKEDTVSPIKKNARDKMLYVELKEGTARESERTQKIAKAIGLDVSGRMDAQGNWILEVSSKKKQSEARLLLEKFTREVDMDSAAFDLMLPTKANREVTIKTLNRMEKEIKKEFVSRQTIEGYIARGDLKQPERDVLRVALEKQPEQVNVARLKEDVLDQLLELTPHSIPLTRWQGISLPDNIAGDRDSYQEVLYGSGIKNNAYEVHFGSSQTEDATFVEDYFAHVRSENMTDYDEVYRRILEVQSDLFQRGRIENEGRVSREVKAGTEVQLENGTYVVVEDVPAGRTVL